MKYYCLIFSFIILIFSCGKESVHWPELSDWDNGKKILFAGDTYFGESYSGGKKILSEFGYDYSFQKVKPFLSETDYIVANFESPVTDQNISPFSGSRTWIHKADIENTVLTLTKYSFSHLSLGNNHIMDYGEEGLIETIDVLNRNNLISFGAGKNCSLASEPAVITFTIDQHECRLIIFGGLDYNIQYDLKYSMYAGSDKSGSLCISDSYSGDKIRQYRKLYPNAFIVIFPHWGRNYSWADINQYKLAQYFFDAGADLIIGHGSHCIEQIDIINGKCSIFSIGNFIFLSSGRYAENPDILPCSFLAVLLFYTTDDTMHSVVRLYPIISDNLISEYMPQPVSRELFEQINTNINQKSVTDLHDKMQTGKDNLGYYFEIAVR
jgi:poly-gamma-glutamate capsule biosynthesis protein CapA/YwtB (metallophosphatase superfamily)